MEIINSNQVLVINHKYDIKTVMTKEDFEAFQHMLPEYCTYKYVS